MKWWVPGGAAGPEGQQVDCKGKAATGGERGAEAAGPRPVGAQPREQARVGGNSGKGGHGAAAAGPQPARAEPHADMQQRTYASKLKSKGRGGGVTGKRGCGT